MGLALVVQYDTLLVPIGPKEESGKTLMLRKPSLFVSSTCYDLKQMREDIRVFIEGLGLNAILSE